MDVPNSTAATAMTRGEAHRANRTSHCLVERHHRHSDVALLGEVSATDAAIAANCCSSAACWEVAWWVERLRPASYRSYSSCQRAVAVDSDARRRS